MKKLMAKIPTDTSMIVFRLLVLLISTTIFFVISTSARAADRVEFSADRIHGLYVFVETISGQAHRSVAIKQLFEQSKFNNAKSKEKIDAFRALDFTLNKFIPFDGLPERNPEQSVHSILAMQASFAKDLNDFRDRAVSLMPMPEVVKLFKVLTYFEPIYDTLLWKPNLGVMQKVAAEFKAKSLKWKLNDLFAKAAKFYGSDWPVEQKFRVSLYPIPKNAEQSNAQAYGAVESVGVIVNEDRESRFGVIFHELCHSLYEAQPLELQKTIADNFKNSSSKFSMLAYSYLNESLATAIGNGWAYQVVKGKVDTGEWYHNDKIDGLSHAIFGKVVEYLNSRKTIDAPFINFVIASFEKRFPQAGLEFEPALTNVTLITDGVVNLREHRRDLKNAFSISNLNYSSPINDDETLKSVRANSSTVFAIVTQKQREQLDTLDDVFKGLSEHIELLPRTGNFLGMFDVGVRKVIVLVIDNATDVPKAFKIMSQKKKVDKLNTFVELKF